MSKLGAPAGSHFFEATPWKGATRIQVKIGLGQKPSASGAGPMTKHLWTFQTIRRLETVAFRRLETVGVFGNISTHPMDWFRRVLTNFESYVYHFRVILRFLPMFTNGTISVPYWYNHHSLSSNSGIRGCRQKKNAIKSRYFSPNLTPPVIRRGFMGRLCVTCHPMVVH